MSQMSVKCFRQILNKVVFKSCGSLCVGDERKANVIYLNGFK